MLQSWQRGMQTGSRLTCAVSRSTRGAPPSPQVRFRFAVCPTSPLFDPWRHHFSSSAVHAASAAMLTLRVRCRGREALHEKQPLHSRHLGRFCARARRRHRPRGRRGREAAKETARQDRRGAVQSLVSVCRALPVPVFVLCASRRVVLLQCISPSCKLCLTRGRLIRATTRKKRRK